MEAQQTFIIEASQQNSVEAPTTENYSAWTNRVEPTLLRRGDYISLNTAIVSQRGASGENNIEFSNEYTNDRDNLQSNFTLTKIGYYLCNNNVNSCPMPFKYAKRQENQTNPAEQVPLSNGRVRTIYNTDRFKNIDGNNVINPNYLLGLWRNPLRPVADLTLDDNTCDELSSFENRNPDIKIDGSRFAKVGNDYNGWERNDDGSKNATIADLLTQDIPLHIEKGFKDARSVGETLTRTLQTTNEPYSDDAEYAVPQSTLYTILATNDAQTQNNPRFNGYCTKSIGANLQKYNDSVTNPLYNNLCVKNPFVWKYGTQILSNTDTSLLVNNGRINTNYLSIAGFTKISYPVILWSTWNVAPPATEADAGVLANYDFYSPHFTDLQPGGGENVLEWSGFTGVLSDYNDYYPEIVDFDNDEEYQNGQMLFKNGLNTYFIYNPPDANHYPTDPNLPFNKLTYRAFMDDDNPVFDRITAWNAKNSLGSDAWSVKGENVLRWSETLEDDFTFIPTTAEDNYAFEVEPNDPTKYIKGTILMKNIVEGTDGGKIMRGIAPNIGLEAGKKYKIRFQSTLQQSVTGTSSNYAGLYYVYYEDSATTTQVFQIDEDKNGSSFHEIVWTQGTATDANGIYLRVNNKISRGLEIVKIVNFQILEASLEEGDKYTITDIFEPNDTNHTSTKIYKLRITSGQLRSEKFNLTDSTIYGGVFNRQYTAYDRFTCYKSGNDIIALDAVNTNDFDHPVILLHQDPNDVNDYIIYNQYGSKVWRIAVISKVPNEIVNGTIIGTIQGGQFTTLRNPFRGGQQYYDMSVGNLWENRTIPVYDFSSGNSWFDGIHATPKNFNMTGGTDPTIGVYDWTFSTAIHTIYGRYNPVGDTPATSGTMNYNNDGWARTWSYDIGTEVFTQVVGATTYNYTASSPITINYTSFNITSFIADPLPTIVAGAPVNQTFSYFASFQTHVSAGPGLITFYLAMNTAGTDDDLLGRQGTLIWDDGGVWTASTWTWNGVTTINLDAYGGMVIEATGGTPTQTSIIEYDSAQRIFIDAVPYDFPTNGKQYIANTFTLLGDGQLTTDPHNPLPVTNNNINEVFLAIEDMSVFNNGYQSGRVYEDINDTAGEICKWVITFNDDGTCDLNFASADGITEYLLLEENSSNVVRYGWQLFKSSKYDKSVADPDQTLTIQGGEDYYTGSREFSPTGTSGRYIPDGTYTIAGETGTTEFLENENLDTTQSNLPRSTMLMTNIKYNLTNLEIIKNYFRYTEIYNGVVESSRGDIAKDVDNYFTNFQLGRTNDDALDVDATQAPYKDSEPACQYYMRDYGKMGYDDSDDIQFTDPNGNARKGSNANYGCICPKMTSQTGHRSNIDIFTRWKGKYTSRLLADNRLINRMESETEYFENNGELYGKEISEDDFKKNYPDLYNYVVRNNVGVYPYLLQNRDATPITYDLCMAFETYRDIDRDNANLLKIQDLTWFGFSPSFLDNQYITPINTDTPYINPLPLETNGQFGWVPSYVIEYNMNLINIGAAPVCQYNPDLNRFQFNYFHTPFKFNEVTGVDADLGEEVAFLNSDTLMIMGQGISENNLQSGGTAGDPPTRPTPIHLGLADAQAGIFLMDIYGQTPNSSYITDSSNGTLITRSNYDNTLFYTLGFSYYDIKPIRFKINSFNNRFNANTYNTISTNFRTLGTSPFTTNSAVNISDQLKTNIFTGVNLKRTYNTTPPFIEEVQASANTNEGTPAFYLGYNSLLAATIKTTSANMTSRSVIVQLQAPFYRVYCDLPLDTMSYLTDGSLSCIGYMTKNYQSQSFIYSFSSDYGGYLTRDVLLTNLRTEIRNPKGLLVSSLDPNSAIFYKVVRNITIQPGLTPKQEEEQAKQLLARQEQEAEEATEQRTISLDVIKFFKQLFSGMNTNAMTEMLGQPSGVDEVYQEAQIEQKEEEAINMTLIPSLDMGVLTGMTQEEEDTPYDTKQHRLFVKMSDVLEDALTNAQTDTPKGIMDLTGLDKEIRQLQLGGDVLQKLMKGLNRVNDRKELRKLVEDTIGDNPNEYTTIKERQARSKEIMKILRKAQDIAIINFPTLGGKNLVRRTGAEGRTSRVFVDTDPTTGDRKLVTQGEREKIERRRMGKESREMRGRKSAIKLRRIQEEGTYDSPLRRRGRKILEERFKKSLEQNPKMGGGEKK